MVRRGLAPTRHRARHDIEAGRVLVGGVPADKPARLVAPDDRLEVAGPPPRFVGRGGDKLDAALDRFAVDVEGRRALDAGSSTGGLHRLPAPAGGGVGGGRRRRLRPARPRACARTPGSPSSSAPTCATSPSTAWASSPLPLIVADLSFISLRTVAPALLGPGRARRPTWSCWSSPSSRRGGSRPAGTGASSATPRCGRRVLHEVVRHLRRGAAPASGG